ncbi:hypothetical protein D4764_06G0008500 [Takifugu flavidus]|uniref:Uncharacterized protein n=1 Tax=Takifugu flavidus TaxID=433684 RepID=A0A5C6N0X2_9TELE|nr:hypothetical protein D4764_06G0008500 [Takifugu flavidus]
MAGWVKREEKERRRRGEGEGEGEEEGEGEGEGEERRGEERRGEETMTQWGDRGLSGSRICKSEALSCQFSLDHGPSTSVAILPQERVVSVRNWEVKATLSTPMICSGDSPFTLPVTLVPTLHKDTREFLAACEVCARDLTPSKESTVILMEYDFGPGHLEKIMDKKDHTNTKGGWKKKMGSSKKKDWIGLN